jgi:hypothetical protein
MIQLYAEIFTVKGFDIREMSATRRSEDGQAPQRYVRGWCMSENSITSTRRGLFLDLRGRLIRGDERAFPDVIAYVTSGS